MIERRAALSEVGIVFDVPLAIGRCAAVHDVLDAGIMAWTATRIRDGVATRSPEVSEIGERGREIAIFA